MDTTWIIGCASPGGPSQLFFARDDLAHDLARARADGERRHVPVEAADGVLLDEAVAAVELEDLVGDVLDLLAGEELRHRGGEARVGRLPAQAVAGPVDELARGLDRGPHVREAM